jgi:hypothetical protein
MFLSSFLFLWKLVGRSKQWLLSFSIPQFNITGIIWLKLVVHYISRYQDHYQNLYANSSSATVPKSLLVFYNAHRKFYKPRISL